MMKREFSPHSFITAKLRRRARQITELKVHLNKKKLMGSNVILALSVEQHLRTRKSLSY
ncbi:hypothetical protein LDENG_00219080, partial [Lucifuga dentata]